MMLTNWLNTKCFDECDQFLVRWSPNTKSTNLISRDRIAKAEDSLEIRFPFALVSWWLRFGHREDIWSRKFLPTTTYVAIDELAFYRDLQGGRLLLKDLGEPNPPVYRGRNEILDHRLTNYFRRMLVLDSTFTNAVYYQSTFYSQLKKRDAIEVLRSSLRDLKIEQSNPRVPQHAYVGDDIVVDIQDNVIHFAVHVDYQQHSPLDILKLTVCRPIEKLTQRFYSLDPE